MKLVLKRYSDNGDSTLGLLFIDDVFFAHTLEDQHQDVKVMNETRIPADMYDIKFREIDSPSTLRYRERYEWFKYHLQIMNVPGFTNIYLHPGVHEKHTSGCVLLGDGINNNQTERGELRDSRIAYARLYSKIGAELLDGKRVGIVIYDEDKIE